MPRRLNCRMLLTPCQLIWFVCAGCADSAPTPVAAVSPVPRAVAIVIVDVDSVVMTAGSSSAARVSTLDAKGWPVDGGAPRWASDPTTVVSVSADGVVTALSAGVGRVLATVDGVEGVRDVVVRPIPSIALIDVSLRKRDLAVGDTLSAQVAVLDSVGNPLAGRDVSWSVGGDDPRIATVSPAGVLTALSAGDATLIATSGDVRGEIDFSVEEPVSALAPVAVVGVSVSTRSLFLGDTTRAVATPLDSSGRTLSQREVSWRIVSGAEIVSLSSEGLVTGIAVGSARIEASVDGVSGGVTMTVSDSTTPPRDSTTPPRDSTTPPVDSASMGKAAIPLPALPETLNFAFPRVTGRQWIVRAGGNLQSALNSAQRGDEVVIQAGARFSGNFTLPAKRGSAQDGWIVVRSDQSSQLPPEGTRVTPAIASSMPVLETPNPKPAISTAPGASGWWLSGLEITVAEQSATNYGLVTFGEGNSQTSLAVVPSDLVLERSYVHGTPTSPLQRCIALNSARTAIQDSYIHECHLKGFDSQAILGWNGPGPFKIVNNTLAGAGENVMFGGADPGIRDLVPSDIVLRQNYIVTPASWKGRWTKKNIVELKNAQRLLIEGNVLDGSWTDGQTGEAFVLKVSNQNGRCTWCSTRDVTIRHNLIRNAGAAFAIMGQQGGSPRPVGEKLNRLLIEQNIAENINVAPYLGSGRLFAVMQNVQNMTIRSNTLTAPNALSHFLMLADIPAGTNFVFERNVVTHGNYGLFSSKYGMGEASLQGFAGTVVFEKNVLIGPQKKGYTRAVFAPTLAAALQRGAGADAAEVQRWTAKVIVP